MGGGHWSHGSSSHHPSIVATSYLWLFPAVSFVSVHAFSGVPQEKNFPNQMTLGAMGCPQNVKLLFLREINICVLRSHAMLNRPLLHSQWNRIKFQGKWLTACRYTIPYRPISTVLKNVRSFPSATLYNQVTTILLDKAFEKKFRLVADICNLGEIKLLQ